VPTLSDIHHDEINKSFHGKDEDFHSIDNISSIGRNSLASSKRSSIKSKKLGTDFLKQIIYEDEI
jgi:hypothetical protein